MLGYWPKRKALQANAHPRAVQLSVSAWDHIDGIMQYECKYAGSEAVEIEAIDLVLRFAPLLFDFESLDKLDVLLKSQRRIEKNCSADLPRGRTEARQLMWDAHRLWNHLEQHPSCHQDKLRQLLGGDQDRWRSLVEVWEKMEIVHRTPSEGSYLLKLHTRMDEPATAKCPSCGAVGKAQKRDFLKRLPARAAMQRCHSY